MSFIIQCIQAILLLIAAILVVIAAIGIIRLSDDDMKNVDYARLHIFGVLDIACIIAFLGLNQLLLALLYFLVAPFVSHAIANAYYNSEDKINNKNEDNEHV
ncbi:cation:proton antiporter [Methanobrevibacter boviskoreani]|jgi:energy-converting hydrogenase B subunit C|uniref:cation:proton antiporter n=1 Tax=Methanobrevibacter boviskoreani TaxID=1348249 RepID=UPI0023A8E6E2|nr:cation:proton antiporter [Methanobrevibacter boviskoreani]MCI6775500.1 cation:proton antiporter [Methanobrevibacter boviskoreani]MCI6930423.1 cation:proton antiporter [Methanobrevibacter boviskoreani]MDD6256851.1 cation:proton antiporter [Methanobrevibacter boviskoreani]